MSGVSVDAYERVCEEREDAWAACDQMRHQRDAARAECGGLRARIEKFCRDLESTDDYVDSWKCARDLRALLGQEGK